jgi:AcrR family transcriptional regulator
MPRPLDPELRSRLIEAATHLFAVRGFAATTLRDIGEAAGVTKGGVYFHFRGKEAMFFAAVDHWRAELARAITPPAGESGSGLDSLRALLARFLAFHFAWPDASRLVHGLASELRGSFTTELREDARAEQRALRARIRDALTHGIRDGSVFTHDPAVAAFLLASSVLGIVEQWLTSPVDAAAFCQPERLADTLVRDCAVRTSSDRPASAAADEDASIAFRPPLDDPPV